MFKHASAISAAAEHLTRLPSAKQTCSTVGHDAVRGWAGCGARQGSLWTLEPPHSATALATAASTFVCSAMCTLLSMRSTQPAQCVATGTAARRGLAGRSAPGWPCWLQRGGFGAHSSNHGRLVPYRTSGLAPCAGRQPQCRGSCLGPRSRGPTDRRSRATARRQPAHTCHGHSTGRGALLVPVLGPRRTGAPRGWQRGETACSRLSANLWLNCGRRAVATTRPPATAVVPERGLGHRCTCHGRRRRPIRRGRCR